MKEFGIPFAFEMYGRIFVDAKTKEEAIEKAQEKLEKMSVSEMIANAEYLEDSEEIDEEGIILVDGNFE